MQTKNHVTELPPEVIQAFAGVRARVQAAVAVRRRSVTLEEALEQVRRIHQAAGTTRSPGQSPTNVRS